MPTSIMPCVATSAVAALIRACGRPLIWRVRILHKCRPRGIISTLIAGTSAVMDIAQWEIAYVPTTGVRRAYETPIVLATEASLKGFGRLVDDPKTFPIEIVRWPAQGWRPIDLNSGDQGGVTEGLSGRRSALLSPQWAEFRHSSGAAGRRCDAGKIRDILVRRRPRLVPAPQCMARSGRAAG